MAKNKNDELEQTPAEKAAEEKRVAEMLKKGWTKPQRASGGAIHEWRKNEIVEGILRGFKVLPESNGQKGGVLVLIEVDGETKTFGCPTLLHQVIANVPIGHLLNIRCLGKVIATKRGQNAWDFEVASADQQKLKM